MTGIKTRKSQESEVIPQISISDNKHLWIFLKQTLWSDRKAKGIITGQSGSEMKVFYTQTHCFKKKKYTFLMTSFPFRKVWIFLLLLLFIFLFREWRRLEGKSSSINMKIFHKAMSHDSLILISNAAAPGIYRVHSPFNSRF